MNITLYQSTAEKNRLNKADYLTVQGIQGPQGPQGPQGEQGPPGVSGPMMHKHTIITDPIQMTAIVAVAESSGVTLQKKSISAALRFCFIASGATPLCTKLNEVPAGTYAFWFQAAISGWPSGVNFTGNVNIGGGMLYLSGNGTPIDENEPSGLFGIISPAIGTHEVPVFDTVEKA